MGVGNRHRITTMPAGNSLGTVAYTRSLAERMSRRSPVDRGLGGAQMLPYAQTWSSSFDTNGVAYPAGLVNVCDVYTGGFSAAGSYPNDLDKNWDDNGTLVPGVLPGGYTPRLRRDVFCGSPGNARVSTGVYRNATGKTTTLWIPCSPLRQRGTTGYVTNTQTQVVDPITFGWVYTYVTLRSNWIGWRSLKFKWDIVADPLSFPDWSGGTKPNLEVTLSHNSDGSDPGSAEGNVVDKSDSLSFSDYTSVGSVHTTRWINCGSVIPSLGVPTTYKIKITPALADHSSPPGTSLPQIGYGVSFASNFYCEESPNLSVPLWFTCTGDNDVIAPGGTV